MCDITDGTCCNVVHLVHAVPFHVLLHPSAHNTEFGETEEQRIQVAGVPDIYQTTTSHVLDQCRSQLVAKQFNSVKGCTWHQRKEMYVLWLWQWLC